MDKQKSNANKEPEKIVEKSIEKKGTNYKDRMNTKHEKKKPKGRK